MMQESETPPPQQEVPKEADNTPWWLNYMCTGMGIFAGVVTFGMGVFTLMTLTLACGFTGFYMLVLGSFTLMLEASCCCQHIESLKRPVGLASRLLPLHKAVIYMLALPVMFVCFTIPRLIPLALVFTTGALNAFRFFKGRGQSGVPFLRSFGRSTGQTNYANDDMKTHLVDQATTGALNAANTPQGRAAVGNVAMGAAQQSWGVTGGTTDGGYSGR